MSVSESNSPFIHPLAVVEPGAEVGPGTKVWHFAHVRSGARIGSRCVIGKNAFIDGGVTLGDGVKVQNNVSVYHGVTIEDGVFLGPHVCFTNDFVPRAVEPNFDPRGANEWTVTPTVVERGASIGANSTIVCGLKLGRWSLVGAGSVVTRSIPPFALAYGNPARIRGIVTPKGTMLQVPYAAGIYDSPDGTETVTIEPEWASDRW